MNTLDKLAAIAGIAVACGTLLIIMIRIGYVVEHGRHIAESLDDVLDRLNQFTGNGVRQWVPKSRGRQPRNG